MNRKKNKAGKQEKKEEKKDQKRENIRQAKETLKQYKSSRRRDMKRIEEKKEKGDIVLISESEAQKE